MKRAIQYIDIDGTEVCKIRNMHSFYKKKYFIKNIDQREKKKLDFNKSLRTFI